MQLRLIWVKWTGFIFAVVTNLMTSATSNTDFGFEDHAVEVKLPQAYLSQHLDESIAVAISIISFNLLPEQ